MNKKELAKIIVSNINHMEETKGSCLEPTAKDLIIFLIKELDIKDDVKKLLK